MGQAFCLALLLSGADDSLHLSLLQDSGIRLELNTTAEQDAAIANLLRMQTYAMVRAKPPIDAELLAWNVDCHRRLAREVLDATQLARLDQIALQRRVGADKPSAGLLHPDVLAVMSLKPHERELIVRRAEQLESQYAQRVALYAAELERLREFSRGQLLLYTLDDLQREQYLKAIGPLFKPRSHPR